MRRADALKALDDALGARLARMCDLLIGAFEIGTAGEKQAAKEHFENGLSHLTEAETFLRGAITMVFPEG